MIWRTKYLKSGRELLQYVLFILSCISYFTVLLELKTIYPHFMDSENITQKSKMSEVIG